MRHGVAPVARRDLARTFILPRPANAIAALFLTLQGLVIWNASSFLGRPTRLRAAYEFFFAAGTILYYEIRDRALWRRLIPIGLLAEERRTGTVATLR